MEKLAAVPEEQKIEWFSKWIGPSHQQCTQSPPTQGAVVLLLSKSSPLQSQVVRDGYPTQNQPVFQLASDPNVSANG